MIGRTVSHYTVLEKLGAGGMGEIYKAQDTRLNRFVAMKVLATANAGDVERRRRFVQEAQAASALNHPNIITIHDVVSTDGLEFMVMEFVSGVTLDDLVPKHGLDAQKTLDCAVQMADALQAAHAAGIIHRDLKPANVMVTGTGLVKILDFGIAKLTGPSPAMSATDETLPIDSPMTVEGSILGTVSYMSPEQAQAKTVDPRSDIFSFGLVLYEMLTGQKAFAGDSALSTLSAILRDEAKPIGELAQGVPPELEQIVHRAMRKDPEQRWQTMSEMRAALLLLKQKADSGVLRTMLDASAVTPPRARKTGAVPLLATAAAIVALVGSGSAGWWWVKHRAPRPAPRPTAVAPPPVAATPVPAAGSVPPVETPAVDAGLTNQNILDMAEAKVPSATIVNQIRAAAKTNFDLSTAGIIQLTKGGVTEGVISVMRSPKADAAAVRAAQHTPPVALPPPNKSPAPGAPSPAETQAAPAVAVAQLPPPAPPVAAPAQVAAARIHTVSVPAGLPFAIALTQDVPAKLTAGQALHFAVSRDVKVGDVVVIAKGTPINGEVADPGDGKKLFGKNKATFKINSVESAGGGKLAIRAIPGQKNDKVDHPIEQTGNKSKEVLAPQGTEYLAYVENDQIVTLKH